MCRGQDEPGQRGLQRGTVLPRLYLRFCISRVSPTFEFKTGEMCVSTVPVLLSGTREVGHSTDAFPGCINPGESDFSIAAAMKALCRARRGATRASNANTYMACPGQRPAWHLRQPLAALPRKPPGRRSEGLLLPRKVTTTRDVRRNPAVPPILRLPPGYGLCG